MRKKLAIIGGVGSLAAAHFLKILTTKQKVVFDQDYLSYVFFNASFLEDRTKAIEKQNGIFEKQFSEIISDLRKLNITHYSVLCNTAHAFASILKSNENLEFISLIDTVFEYISRFSELEDTIFIVLGTKGTYNSNIYKTNAYSNRFNIEYPPSNFIDYIYEIIYEIKSQNLHSIDFDKLNSKLRQLVLKYPGKRVFFILGCTELSLIKDSLNREIGLIDSSECLVDKLLELKQDLVL